MLANWINNPFGQIDNPSAINKSDVTRIGKFKKRVAIGLHMIGNPLSGTYF